MPPESVVVKAGRTLRRKIISKVVLPPLTNLRPLVVVGNNKSGSSDCANLLAAFRHQWLCLLKDCKSLDWNCFKKYESYIQKTSQIMLYRYCTFRVAEPIHFCSRPLFAVTGSDFKKSGLSQKNYFTLPVQVLLLALF